MQIARILKKYVFNTDYIKCIQSLSQIFISLFAVYLETTVRKVAHKRREENYISVDSLHSDSIHQMSSKATKARFSCYNNWSLTTAALVGNISGVVFQLVWNYFTAILLPLTFRCKVKPSWCRSFGLELRNHYTILISIVLKIH